MIETQRCNIAAMARLVWVNSNPQPGQLNKLVVKRVLKNNEDLDKILAKLNVNPGLIKSRSANNRGTLKHDRCLLTQTLADTPVPCSSSRGSKQPDADLSS